MAAPGAGSGSVAEQIISEMILDATQYEAGAARVIAADRRLIASASAVSAAYRAMYGVMGTGGGGAGGGGGFNGNFSGNTFSPSVAFGGGGGGGGGGTGTGGGGFGGYMGFYLVLRGIREVEHAFEELGHKFISFSEDALKQYASFNTLQLSFEGIFHSSEKAAQMMAYLRDVAMTSAFHFKDLADAARGISVAGLDVGRFLPMVQGFALAMGHIDGSGLEDFVSILRRLQGGNTGFALGPRGIGRYGVSRAELETHGAKFDEKGHFLGSINEAFDAVEAVFNARIKGIADKVQQSAEVVLSNFGDAMQQATIDFGSGMADNVLGPIKEVTTAINSLRTSGFFKDLSDTIYGILNLKALLGNNADAKFDFKDKAAFHRYENERFDIYADAPGQTARAHSSGTPIQDILIRIGGYLVELTEWAREEVVAFNKFLSFLHISPDNLLGSGPKAAGEDFMRRAYADARHAYDQRYINGNPDAPESPTGNAIEGLDDDIVESNQHLKKIREHTGRIAAHMDSRATAFGGGDIGRYGVTPVEMGQYYHSLGTGIGGKFAQFGTTLEREVHRMVMDGIKLGMRQGYLQARGS